VEENKWHMKDQEQTLHGVRREVDGDRRCMAWASTAIRSEIGKDQPEGGITRMEEATLDRSGIGKGNFYVKLRRISSAC
jgi:hypothetical protein